MPFKTWDFEVKSLEDNAGTFLGLASTYNGIDEVGDRILPGAFTRTLAEKGGSRTLLVGHKEPPVGIVKLEDSPEGLIARGKLSLGTQAGRDAYQLLRDRVLGSLSIGYRTIQERMKGEVRELLELKLWEVSLVWAPANPDAVITSVKSQRETQKIEAALADLLLETRKFKG
jgi:uncharacterized protein